MRKSLLSIAIMSVLTACGGEGIPTPTPTPTESVGDPTDGTVASFEALTVQ